MSRPRGNAAADVIKSGVPIEKYAATITELKPGPEGKLVGLCPMHVEDTPSFKVDPERHRFFCRGACGVWGDVIELFLAVEGGTEAAAISALADRFGVELPAMNEEHEREGVVVARSNARTRSRRAGLSVLEEAGRLAGLGGRVKLGERIAGGIEPPEQLVEGCLYAGKLHAFNSEPGEGKTTAAFWAACEVMGQGRSVLYLDAENGPGFAAERLQSMGASIEDLDRLMHYHSSPELTLDADSLADLSATVGEVEPALVVFDSLPDFLATAGLNENDAGDVTRWILEVVQPLKDRGVAVLLLDHVTKSTEGRGRYARGSGAKLAKCDVVWTLSQTVRFDRGEVGELRLALRKDRDAFMPRVVNYAVGGTPDGLMFRRAAGVVEVPDAADGLTESQRTALKDLQSRAGEEGLTYAQWKAGAGLPDSTFDRAREVLVRRGLARRIKQRYHAINPEPPLYPHGGTEDEDGRGGSGGKHQTKGGDTTIHRSGGENPDTYAESTNPHEPPHNPHGGNGGCVQTRTPTNPHTPLRGGGGGGWTGGDAKESPDPVAELLSNPPDWFVRQADECARKGGVESRLFNPLVSSVAFDVYRTAAGRCDEVRPAVEAWVRELQERARDA